MIWFSSDQHFGHKRVLEYCQRPWSTLDEMEEGLVANWNGAVSSDDTVYVLGDFSFRGVKDTTRVLSRLRGHKCLVMGNHDWHHKPTKWVEMGFKCVADDDWLMSPVGKLLMSHFPYKGSGDHTQEQRYEEKRLIDHGDWLLHGHVHNAWRTKGRMFNVGVDKNNYTPVSLDEVKSTIIALERSGACGL